MRVAIEKVEGVREVEVTLADGLARIELEPGNRVTVEQLRRAVRDQGFTPKAARVRVAGRVVESSGALALAVTGLDLKLPLRAAPEGDALLAELRRRTGEGVVLDAEVPERPTAEERLDLTVHAVVEPR